ncbi:MAG TPA: hypothetical protein VEQ60_21455 [Longimicrobium sp.]|nr:hypothetical protein [Longimicrobium sp.]
MSHVAERSSSTAVTPAVEPASGWKPAAVIGMAIAGTVVLNVAEVPGILSSHWVPVLLLATAFTAAVRWKRTGVRRQLRNRAAAGIQEYGGGVYGAMAMATLLQLEAADLVDDVASAGSLAEFVGALDVGWLMGQMMESVGFAIRAGLWPWHWFSEYGMSAVLVAAGAAFGLDALLKSVSSRYRALREKPAVAATS